MRTAIVFTTKHGATRRVAEEMKALRPDIKFDLINLREEKNPDLDHYSTVIIGMPVYQGLPSLDVEHFCMDYVSLLRSKKLGLFVCGVLPAGEDRNREMDLAYSIPLVSHAAAYEFINSSYDVGKLNFIERFMLARRAGRNTPNRESCSKDIQNFMKRMFPY